MNAAIYCILILLVKLEGGVMRVRVNDVKAGLQGLLAWAKQLLLFVRVEETFVSLIVARLF